MFDESAYIDRVEASEPAEFALQMARPSDDEEYALRRHFGDERYRRLHDLAVRQATRASRERPLGRVVVIPGVMGSELESVDRAGDRDHLWVSPLRLLSGGLRRLRLADDGRHEADPNFAIRASGIMKRYYGELLLTLHERADVRAFWYDWRKDLRYAADGLRAATTQWFDDDEPFHIVAHSLGGLVARTFIMNHAERWEATPGRLVMLGTPNHGAYGAVQAMSGLDSLVRKLGVLSSLTGSPDLLEILNSFPAAYQLLPSPFLEDGMEKLYQPDTWAGIPIMPDHLTNARDHHRRLNSAKRGGRLKLTADPARMVSIAGYGWPTITGIDLTRGLDDERAFDITLDGDGRVARGLVVLKDPDLNEVTTLFVNEEHGRLPANPRVLAALGVLLDPSHDPRQLDFGLLPGLRDAPPGGRSRTLNGKQRDNDRTAREAVCTRLASLLGDLQTRAPAAAAGNGGAPASSRTVSDEEREIADLLLSEVVAGGEPTPAAKASRAPAPARAPTSQIAIDLVLGGIQEDGARWITDGEPWVEGGGEPPKPLVDAIVVGHYSGGRPESAEQALDRVITAALTNREGQRPEQRVLTQFSDRRLLPEELGRFFFMPDPRKGQEHRLIALAGMGPPGRFGVPELIVLVRELCWTLATLGRRHAATTLIGVGNRNLSTPDAVYAWTRGIRAALRGRDPDSSPILERITLVNTNPAQILDIDRVLRREQDYLKDHGLTIAYTGIGEAWRQELTEKGAAYDLRRFRGQRDEASADPTPTRMTLEGDEGGYRFGLIAEGASVPERVTQIDADIVDSANRELANEPVLRNQIERGRFLNKLLFPAELSNALATDTPLVMILDTRTARIHWEMVTQPEQYEPDSRERVRLVDAGRAAAAAGIDQTAGDEEAMWRFLGTARGFTRQLRTTAAPAPELPPPPRRELRVLVVGDPAADARLRGAEAEAVRVAQLFESYNQMTAQAAGGKPSNSIKVVSLLGPTDATRTNVLRELLNDRYDVLHFAGHCFFDPVDPTACGWLFQKQPRKFISAKELSRIDRIPKFVFSNACESGVMPDRGAPISEGLGPSFAEAFFNQGVANFICTAWEVDDEAAAIFARRLYAGLLGLSLANDEPVGLQEPEPLWHALREARRETAKASGGQRTWGAYQHYGNPYYMFFARGSGAAAGNAD